jgi:hypothetical protein
MEVDALHDPAATSDAAAMAAGGGVPCCEEEVGGMNLPLDSSGEEMLRNYGVGEEFKPLLAEDGWEPWTLPEGSNIMCVFESMLVAGVQLPLHDFYVDYLHHYSIAPGQLTPNAWRYLVGFVKLCDDVRVPQTVPVFQYYFSINICSNSGKRWYCKIVPSSSRRLFKPDALPCNEGWKKRFFFLKSTVPWRCPEKWGTPKPDSFADPELTDAEKKAIEKLEAWKERNVSVMELLRNADDDAASMPPPKKKLRSLSVMISSPSEQLTIAKESSGNGNEHFSASRILMDASKAVQRIEKELQNVSKAVQRTEKELQNASKAVQRSEKELQNAKDELRQERTKHAADVAQMEEALGAATEKLQAAEAKHADVSETLQSLQAAAAKEHEAKVRHLMDELRKERDKHMQLMDERHKERDKHMTKLHQYPEELRAAETGYEAKVKAVMVECQRKIIQEKNKWSAEMAKMMNKWSAEMAEMSRKKYAEGWKDSRT